MSEEKTSSEVRLVAAEDAESRRISIRYIKSNSFRVIHADGAWGGLTPHLKIQMALYSERTAIPRSVVHVPGPDGTLGEEISKELRSDLVREVEADVIMDLNVAIALRDWLDTRIRVLQQAMEEAKARKKPD